MRYILAAVLALAAAPAGAQISSTTRLGLALPANGTLNWGTIMNNNVFQVLDATAADQYAPNTFTSSNTFTAPVLLPGTSVQLTGSLGYFTGASSVTASAFFGDISHTTGGAAPTGAASGVLAGNYPDPTLGSAVILSSHIANGAIDTAQIQTDAVVTASVLNGNITTAKIASGAINTGLHAADSVTTSAILNGNVTTAKIASGAINTGLLATDAVTAGKILNGTIDTSKLGFASIPGTACLHSVNGVVSGTVGIDCGTGGGGSLISTGTLAASATSFPLRNQLMFDSTFANVTDTPTANATFVTFKNMGGITSTPTHQIFQSASNLKYATPNGVSLLHVHGWAQGGGGGANATNAGTVGSSTTWISLDGSTISAVGGGAGPAGVGGASVAGGVGGTGGLGGWNVWTSSSVTHSPGSGGGSTMNASDSYGSFGGASGCGGGGAAGTASSSQQSAAANSGGGGSGGGNSTISGGGGGGAECFDLWIANPGSAYWITVGSLGGQGGVAGTVTGGNGGTGGLTVDEYYGTQGFSAPSSTWTMLSMTSEPTATNTTLAVAVTTATLTTSGGRLRFDFDCPYLNATTNDGAQAGILVDGNYVDAETASVPMSFSLDNLVAGSVPYLNLGIHYTSTGTYSAGTHSVALMLGASTGGTATFKSSKQVCMLSVVELKNATGTGDVASSGGNTLSGVNTISPTGSLILLSTMTVGPTVYSSSASFASIIKNEPTTVFLSSYTAASSIYIYNLSSSAYHYELFVEGVVNTSNGLVELTFNGDAGAHYYGSNSGTTHLNQTAEGLVQTGTAYYDAVNCITESDTPVAGAPLETDLVFNQHPSIDNNVHIQGRSKYWITSYSYGSSNNLMNCWGMEGEYTGSAPMTSMKITMSAGTFTGWIELKATVPGLWP